MRITPCAAKPITLMEAVFPLHDHPEVLVVEQQHLHWELFAEAGGQFLNVHLARCASLCDPNFTRSVKTTVYTLRV